MDQLEIGATDSAGRHLEEVLIRTRMWIRAADLAKGRGGAWSLELHRTHE